MKTTAVRVLLSLTVLWLLGLAYLGGQRQGLATAEKNRANYEEFYGEKLAELHARLAWDWTDELAFLAIEVYRNHVGQLPTIRREESTRERDWPRATLEQPSILHADREVVDPAANEKVQEWLDTTERLKVFQNGKWEDRFTWYDPDGDGTGQIYFGQAPPGLNDHGPTWNDLFEDKDGDGVGDINLRTPEEYAAEAAKAKE